MSCTSLQASCDKPAAPGKVRRRAWPPCSVQRIAVHAPQHVWRYSSIVLCDQRVACVLWQDAASASLKLAHTGQVALSA